MFNATGSHAEMLRPRAIRAVSDAQQYRSYESSDESTKPRTIGRPVQQSLRQAPGSEETIPTTTEAPQPDFSEAFSRVQDTAFHPELTQVSPGPSPGTRHWPPEDPGQAQPRPLVPYEPVVPGAEDAFSPGAEPYPPGAEPYSPGGGPAPNGGGMPNGAPGPNGDMVPGGADNGYIEGGYGGKAEGPLMPGDEPAGAMAPIYMQPWFWGVAAVGIAGAGALYYYYGMKKRRA